MPDAVDPRLVRLLSRRLPQRDRPTELEHTVEASAFWRDDFLDAVQAGRRRSIRVGGLRKTGINNLAVDLPPPHVPFEMVRIDPPTKDAAGQLTATISHPQAAEVAVRTPEGHITHAPSDRSSALAIGLHEACAFRLGELAFLIRFVHWDGASARPSWLSWLKPAPR